MWSRLTSLSPGRSICSLAAGALALSLAAGLPRTRSSHAAEPVASAAAPTLDLSAFQLAFEKYTLANGLEVILHRDSSLPRVAVNVWYHVGPANEPPGR